MASKIRPTALSRDVSRRASAIASAPHARAIAATGIANVTAPQPSTALPISSGAMPASSASVRQILSWSGWPGARYESRGQPSARQTERRVTKQMTRAR